MLGTEDTSFIEYIATRAEEAYIRSLYQEIARKLRHVRLNPGKLNQGRRTDSTDECCGVDEQSDRFKRPGCPLKLRNPDILNFTKTTSHNLLHNERYGSY